ncbi:MAG TPA: hypothetical protein VKY42_12640 [Trueperaceae bacterium]|mgnify:CR=1 FL=1|nr:hypothetical protein [Trueperaceae bacterium]
MTDYAAQRPTLAPQRRDEAAAAAGRAAGGPFRLALPLYLALLGVLAALGAANQAQLARQVDLARQKEALLVGVARAEVRAGAVESPLAVARWATAAGMVPLPQGNVTSVVAPEPAPADAPPAGTLELRTVWR